MNTLLLTLALPLLAQEPAPQEPRQEVLLDGIAVQAGEELVTLSEYQRVMNRYRKSQPPSNADEEMRMRGTVLRDMWTLRLEEQKGRDMGLDPAMITRINRSNLQQDRERAGLENYLQQLHQEGKDALREEGDKQRELWSQLWEYTALGNAVAGRRATQDRTIRPGELRAIFEENKRALAPIEVQLRWLIVSSAAAGGAEQAKASCEDARRRVEAGEDLALIIEEIGVQYRDTRGLTPYAPVRAIPEPALWAFAEKAEIADLSEVQPLTNPKTGKPDPNLGYSLAELNDRKIPEEPEFETLDVQRILRSYFTKQRQDRLLGRERDVLRREAYSWVNPLIGGPPPTPSRTEKTEK